ncbi:MAG: hypothetical protein VX589_01425, partial [Myxococcota bacterium]|nr:hypothetical protein [Myxococcota bacterium]
MKIRIGLTGLFMVSLACLYAEAAPEKNKKAMKAANQAKGPQRAGLNKKVKVAKQKKFLRFKKGLSKTKKLAIIKKIDTEMAASKSAKNSSQIASSIKIWEGFNPEQKLQMLTDPAALAEQLNVAALAASMFIVKVATCDHLTVNAIGSKDDVKVKALVKSKLKMKDASGNKGDIRAAL